MITKQNLTSPRDFLPVTEVSLIWKEQWKLLVDAGPTNYYTANCTHIPDDGHGCSSESPCLFDLQADRKYHSSMWLALAHVLPS